MTLSTISPQGQRRMKRIPTLKINMDISKDPIGIKISVPYPQYDIKQRIETFLGEKLTIIEKGKTIRPRGNKNRFDSVFEFCKQFYKEFGYLIEGRVFDDNKTIERIYYPENESEKTPAPIKFSLSTQGRILKQIISSDEYLRDIMTGNLHDRDIDHSGKKLYDGLKSLGIDMDMLMTKLISSRSEEVRKFGIIYGNKELLGLIDNDESVRAAAKEIYRRRKETESSSSKE